MDGAAGFQAGFVVLLGRPNAGKSTLLNTLLKRKLSIVSPKPQTTRHRILGILEGEAYQICLVDTPGIVEDPRDPLQNCLRRQALGAAHEDPDVMVLLVEPDMPDEAALRDFSGLVRMRKPILLVLNKTDLPAAAGRHDRVVTAYAEALQPAAALRICARTGEGVDALLARIIKHLPVSPPFYDQGQLTDRWERFFAAEIIREAVFELYSQEIPHATAVVVERFQEIPGGSDVISATLYIERDGQKGIILGQNGRDLRRLQDKARQGIAEFLGRPVVVELWVKVRKNWRKDLRSLKEFGYLS